MDHLAFGLGYAVHRAELAQVGHTHLEDQGQVRGNNPGQMRYLTNMVGPHLGHQEPRPLTHLQGCQRQSYLIVEGTDRSYDRSQCGQQGGQEVLGRGLTDRTGDADDREISIRRPAQFNIALGKEPQSLDGVIHQNLRQVSPGNRVVHQGGAHSTGTHPGQEVMPVHPFSTDGHKEGALPCLP